MDVRMAGRHAAAARRRREFLPTAPSRLSPCHSMPGWLIDNVGLVSA